MSFFSFFLVHAIRKRLQASRLRLACPILSELKTRSPDWVESRILPVTFYGGTLSRQLMDCNRTFMSANATHRPLPESNSLLTILLMSPLIFFSPSNEEKGKAWRIVQGRSCNKVKIFGEFWKSLEKLKKTSFPQISSILRADKWVHCH